MGKPLNQGVVVSDFPSQALDVDLSEPVEEPSESTREAHDDEGTAGAPATATKTKSGVAVDFLATPMPRLELELSSKRFLACVCAMIAFTTTFTIGFYFGITVDTVYEDSGSTATESDELVETYNTVSGYVMALLETFLSLHMDQFMPVLDVYVHNSLFFLRRKSNGQLTTKRSRQLHIALLLLFPIVLTLTMDNSLRGLQASHSSTHVKRIMSVDDMKKEQSQLERIKTNGTRSNETGTSVYDTILKNAIRQQSDPFMFDTLSACRKSDLSTANGWLPLATHDVDTTSVVYGFIPREWNSEAISLELAPTTHYNVTHVNVTDARKMKAPLQSPANFPIKTAYEMLVQAKVQIERAQGEAVAETYDCVESDGRQDLDTKLERMRASEVEWNYDEDNTRQCEGAPTSLFEMGSFYDRADSTIEDLVEDVGNVFATTLPDLSREDTTVILETYDLTPQIHVEAMRIDVAMDKSVEYADELSCDDAEPCVPIYSYYAMEATFCGSNGCAFIDASETFLLQREIGVVPYVTNCTLDAAHVHYNASLRGFYPSDCKRVVNTAFLYGFGSYISGDDYGAGGLSAKNVGGASDNAKEKKAMRKAPFILAPRRHIRFTFAKVTWATEDLATKFDAKCEPSNQHKTCSGLWYELQPSGRYLFAGEDALPTQKLALADLHSPITLVQLNPAVPSDNESETITLERLSPSNFNHSNWKTADSKLGTTLQGSNCSKLMDSYLKHIETNNFYLEFPLQAMYTSFFYFLMENGVATQLREGLNDPSAEVNNTNETTPDLLGNVKLQGDVQVRTIRVMIPKNAFRSTFGVCIIMAIMVLVIAIVPARMSEYFDVSVTKAQRFVVLRNDTKYPDAVYEKMLLDSASGKSVLFDEVKIEGMALVHKAESDRVVHL